MQSIPRRLTRCILGGESFDKGSEYVSFLDAEGNRKDYCPLCWEKITKTSEGHFWKGKIPLKKERLSNPDQRALELFKESCDPKIRFVLALYLQRKQQLVRRTPTLYEIPATGELFNVEKEIPNPEESAALAHTVDQLINEHTPS